jgi:hypothetical protein
MAVFSSIDIPQCVEKGESYVLLLGMTHLTFSIYVKCKEKILERVVNSDTLATLINSLRHGGVIVQVQNFG